MLKVKVKDFQSIANMSLDIEGFTVIVGKNNKGKSALVRAIDAALKNRPGNNFIKWGKTKTEVSLIKDDLDIKWIKEDSASYVINKKTYTKLNKSVPKPILDAGFKPLEVAGEKINPLVANQFEEVFLINKTGAFVTEAISTLYDFNILNDADILCQKRLRAKKGILKTRESDLIRLCNNIKKFDGLSDLKSRSEALKLSKQKTENLGQEVALLEKYEAQLKTQANLVMGLKKITKIKIPQINRAESLLKDYSELSLFKGKYQKSKHLMDNFNVLPEINLPDTEKITSLMNSYSWLGKTANTFKGYLQLVQKLKGIPEIAIPETKKIEKQIENLKSITLITTELKRYILSSNICKESLDKLKNIDDINNRINKLNEQIDELTYLEKSLTDLEAYKENVKELRCDAQSALLDYDVLKTELAKFKVCPLCNKPREIEND